ncbi:hypothetical protein CYLTODRAFT_440528 [Cylindrobasidium torrendii FP15055 ss-10]|uniref:Uncharacterized protein n=1 Tax=Cylindrobasidium torrendii FP15055 ss-10 TaxID=1314674 RepID=A0A0D7BSP7_9AGAR|nr:hypothetical protein CYLTODRAFT_440528 [Cylindrobasidium torrendii FP15055 ss-10]
MVSSEYAACVQTLYVTFPAIAPLDLGPLLHSVLVWWPGLSVADKPALLPFLEQNSSIQTLALHHCPQSIPTHTMLPNLRVLEGLTSTLAFFGACIGGVKGAKIYGFAPQYPFNRWEAEDYECLVRMPYLEFLRVTIDSYKFDSSVIPDEVYGRLKMFACDRFNPDNWAKFCLRFCLRAVAFTAICADDIGKDS